MDLLAHNQNGLPGEPSEHTLRRLWSIGHFSLISSLLLFTFLGWLYRGEPDSPYGETWALIIAHFVGGRAGNAGVGLELGFSPWFLMYQAFIQDFIVMCYLFPLFVRGHDLLTRFPSLGQSLEKFHAMAVARREQIRPYGIVGLFLFVLFPFWSTGPLVGVFVGYVIGLRVSTTFITVVIADALATGAWMWAYDSLRAFNRELALVLLAIVLVVSLGGALVTRIARRWNKNRKAESLQDQETVEAAAESLEATQQEAH
jgi:uncharacterized membrane protein